ncbi:hypothetical protein HanXRQr2_Chr04g0175161 [Helianthus annuus]|uniref:Uncharacterized protein n=1 Tax=Helianthus annuus TaxID=4232 RepID=A0A9K3NT26_HELAN|nr:hypothetical protein HanXRQr2_Chr04g0175161 [Helianthus annuus]
MDDNTSTGKGENTELLLRHKVKTESYDTYAILVNLREPIGCDLSAL